MQSIKLDPPTKSKSRTMLREFIKEDLIIFVMFKLTNWLFSQYCRGTTIAQTGQTGSILEVEKYCLRDIILKLTNGWTPIFGGKILEHDKDFNLIGI